ncbi:DNA-processing protein DprA [Cupriavidus basilensis]
MPRHRARPMRKRSAESLSGGGARPWCRGWRWAWMPPPMKAVWRVQVERSRTIGTGIDRVYPASNLELARRIAEQGAIVSEFPLGTRGFKDNFPRRNRLIQQRWRAGLCSFVVEAAARSGSLITAPGSRRNWDARCSRHTSRFHHPCAAPRAVAMC